MAKLEFYFDPLSEPCRSVHAFLEANNIPYEAKITDLISASTRTEEFKKINPAQTIPAIRHGDFKLFESVAILQYLAAKFSTADHWYPSAATKRARINEYLHWHHMNARWRGGMLVVMKYLYVPHFFKQEVSEEDKKASIAALKTTVDTLENYFLKDHPFIAGDEISIADLMAIEEMIEPDIIGVYVGKGRPKVEAWHHNVKKALGAAYDKVHEPLLQHKKDVQDLVAPIDF